MKLSLGRAVSALLALALLAFAVAACGDDEESGGGAASEGTANAAAECSGEPVPIALQYLDENPITISNQMLSAAQAAVNHVNANGCLGGRPAKLISCFGTEANSEQSCSRELIEQKPVALSLNALNEANLLPIWQEAKVPLIGWFPILDATLQPDVTTSFPLMDISRKYYAAPAVYLGKHKDQKIAIMQTDTPSGGAAAAELKKLLEDATGKEVTLIAVPPTATDMAPYVASAHAKGATAVVMYLGAAAAVQFVRADSQAPKPFDYYLGTYYNATGVYLKQYGEAASKLVIGSPFPTIDQDIPGVNTFREALEKEFDGGDKNAALDLVDDHSYLAWLTVIALQQIAPDVETWDAAGVTAALEQATDLDFGGIIPPWSPGSASGSSRLTNDTIRVIGFSDGEHGEDLLSEPRTLDQLLDGET
jgi:ABC-type branched-subunit amino acid transport system substrate-binding protein